MQKKSELKQVEYHAAENPHVGDFECPNCTKSVPAWRSSGMSDLGPHFYCSDCNNAIFRQSDQKLIWEKRGDDELQKITETLPNCDCGGRFKPGENPKCPDCKWEFKHQGSAIERLSDPHLILVDGAILYGEDGPEYQLHIIAK
ncbi:hypothetical protein FEE96_04715 [Parasedimentitalea maritima]|uniref:Uncharacterized protein n=1 Tax=Parasedimentitalea maritima TaxID=2578117 RepID=A0ABY2UY81_9RHOB|nr:hypothetical protein [Zongyanglinia marina]TLP67837.1 hypothetical protein FEE96_04715 [Zongyanglinia marina]